MFLDKNRRYYHEKGTRQINMRQLFVSDRVNSVEGEYKILYNI